MVLFVNKFWVICFLKSGVISLEALLINFHVKVVPFQLNPDPSGKMWWIRNPGMPIFIVFLWKQLSNKKQKTLLRNGKYQISIKLTYNINISICFMYTIYNIGFCICFPLFSADNYIIICVKMTIMSPTKIVKHGKGIRKACKRQGYKDSFVLTIF